MSVIEGIAAYKARKAEEDARREAASKPRVARFNLEKDGDSVTFRFAQEIDPDATNYNAERGIGFINIEHNHPDPKRGWLNRANCTLDSQGNCYPCERVTDQTVDWNGRKGWKQKEKFYINVIAGPQREVKYRKANGEEGTRYFPTDLGTDDETNLVYLVEQGTYNGIWDQLVAAAVENETITDTLWKITRKGNNFNDTSYTLTQLPKKSTEKLKDLSEFELVNLKEDVLKEIPYNQQKAFYHKGIDLADEQPAASDDTPFDGSTPVSAGSTSKAEAW